MRIAFGIVSLFPGGGLQRDCAEIAKLVQTQGAEVVIYTSRLRDCLMTGDISVRVLRNNAVTNHGRQFQFASDFRRETAGRFDLIVGFDKLAGLDVIYCADASMGYRALKAPWLRLLSRYRTYLDMEKSSFTHGMKTKIIVLSQNQVSEYQSAWATELSRMLLVPPTLTLARRQPGYRTNGARAWMRFELGFDESDWVWLAIGVQPNTKGIDRAVNALRKFPHAKLLIAGLSETDHNSLHLARKTHRLGIAHRVKWLGHREDIAKLMAAADLLVHPARYDTTGTVILEAVVNGLPVITTAACGYARHVDFAGAGVVIREPFDFRLFVAALDQARNPSTSSEWSLAGIKYGKNPMLYQGRLHAAQAILQSASEKGRMVEQTGCNLRPSRQARPLADECSVAGSTPNLTVKR